MRVGIVGNGVVGSALAKVYRAFGDEMAVYDKASDKSDATIQVVLNADVVFLCLPTPQKAGGLGCDTSAILDFLQVARYAVNPETFFGCNFVLRSTVPVGFTRAISEMYQLRNLVHSPEFLTARTAEEDAAHPRLNVIGVPQFGPSSAPATPTTNPVLDLYSARFPHVPVSVVSSDESETIKLAMNSFFAVKVAFFNELRSFTDVKGIDYAQVVSSMVAEGRISELHTKVPGADGFGFSGTCLPKDLASLIDCIERAGGCSAPLMNAALNRNRIDRAKDTKGVK